MKSAFFLLSICTLLFNSCNDLNDIQIQRIIYTSEPNGSFYIQIDENGTVLYSGSEYGRGNAFLRDYEVIFSSEFSSSTFNYFANELKLNKFHTQTFEYDPNFEFLTEFGKRFFRVYYNDTYKDFVVKDKPMLRLAHEIQGLIRYNIGVIVADEIDREFINKANNYSLSSLTINGDMYGCPDKYVNLIFDRIPDSLRIDTLLAGSKIYISKNGIQNMIVDSASNYNINLDAGYIYELEFTHPSYVSKRLKIDTSSIPELGNVLFLSLGISMFSPNVAQELNESLCDIKYNPEIKEMDWDKEQFKIQVAKMIKPQ